MEGLYHDTTLDESSDSKERTSESKDPANDLVVTDEKGIGNKTDFAQSEINTALSNEGKVNLVPNDSN